MTCVFLREAASLGVVESKEGARGIADPRPNSAALPFIPIPPVAETLDITKDSQKWSAAHRKTSEKDGSGRARWSFGPGS
jgi:hypothetical protein